MELIESNTKEVLMNGVTSEKLKQEIKLGAFRYSQEKEARA